MREEKFFKRIKTCEATYGNNENVKYVIFTTINNLYLGVIVYIHRQLKSDGSKHTNQEKHFPAITEQEAIDSCEKWIKDNISSNISVNCN